MKTEMCHPLPCGYVLAEQYSTRKLPSGAQCSATQTWHHQSGQPKPETYKRRPSIFQVLRAPQNPRPSPAISYTLQSIFQSTEAEKQFTASSYPVSQTYYIRAKFWIHFWDINSYRGRLAENMRPSWRFKKPCPKVGLWERAYWGR